MQNIDLVKTVINTPGIISGSEMNQISESLQSSGIAVIKGFIKEDLSSSLLQDANECVQEGYDAGLALGVSIKMGNSEATAEFGHPFLVSKAAVDLVTNPLLLKLVETYLGDKAIIHHALFQHSIPISEPAVDWHVDTGSNKVLNGSNRFLDRRLRMIVYLTNVESGGLSYILDSRDATTHFLSLPPGSLYPQSDIPAKLSKAITINETAGTIILFDAHGLHRPEPPKDSRLVLNVWFARADFSASLPPTLISVANIPPDQVGNMYIFGNERGAKPKHKNSIEKPSLSGIRKIINAAREMLRIRP